MPDRNFDDLAARFSRRIYGGLKGQIRLAVIKRDLDRLMADQQNQTKKQALDVLDIGSGLSQLAIELAGLGHRVSCNDLSEKMLQQAQQAARSSGVAGRIQWHHGPYQQLDANAPCDLLLCHALLEWLDKPEEAIAFATHALKPGGLLSLCFYNPDGKIYRNLIRGNFDWLDNNADYLSDVGSLTPNNPCTLDEVTNWLNSYNFHIVSTSGVRVFYDYVVEKRGGHADPAQVIRKELEYSDKPPYLFLGRYLHVCAKLKN